MSSLTLLKILGIIVVCSHVNGSDVDQAMTGTIQGTEGDSITLVCDLRDINGVDNIWFSNTDHYLTSGESIEARPPSSIAGRLSVKCYAIQESCSLTIANLMESDSSTYMCGDVTTTGGFKRKLASANLIVLVPPTDLSPACNLYDDSNRPIDPTVARVGDKVKFSCTITGGNPRPTLYIARKAEPITVTAKGSFSHSYELSANDEGLDFWCVMEHPTLPRPRKCLLLTLVSVSTTSAQSTIASIDPTSTTMPSRMTSSVKSTRSNVAQPSVPVVKYIVMAVGVFLLVLIATVTCFLLWHARRKRYQKQIHTKPDYELTINHDCSISADYVVVSAKDAIDKALEVKSMLKSSTEKSFLQDQKSSKNAKQSDTYPIYAKPDKTNVVTNSKTLSSQYEVLPHASDGIGQKGIQQDGLMYADLDLTINSSSDSARKPPVNQDATVYADIKGTI